MPAILQGGDVAVKRLPFVGDDGQPAAGVKLLRNLLALQGGGIGIPTYGLVRFRLGQTLQEANAVAVGIKAIEVIEDDGPVLMAPELAVVLSLKVTGLDPL